MIVTNRPDPVGTFLVFLHLLERQSEGVRKLRLAHSKHEPAHAYSAAHMFISGGRRLLAPRGYFASFDHLVGAGAVLSDTVDVDLGHSPVSITRARIWRKILEFVRLPLPLPPVERGRFFDRNIWPDFRVFRIQRQPFLKPRLVSGLIA